MRYCVTFEISGITSPPEIGDYGDCLECLIGSGPRITSALASSFLEKENSGYVRASVATMTFIDEFKLIF